MKDETKYNNLKCWYSNYGKHLCVGTGDAYYQNSNSFFFVIGISENGDINVGRCVSNVSGVSEKFIENRYHDLVAEFAAEHIDNLIGL